MLYVSGMDEHHIFIRDTSAPQVEHLARIALCPSSVIAKGVLAERELRRPIYRQRIADQTAAHVDRQWEAMSRGT